MRRLSFFILLGPLLVWLAFAVLVIPEALIKHPKELPYYTMMVVVFYVAGAIPLLTLAGVDEVLARYQVKVRPLICAVAGYAAAIAILYFLAQLLGAQKEFAARGLVGGSIGAIPGAVCSWLSSEKQNSSL